MSTSSPSLTGLSVSPLSSDLKDTSSSLFVEDSSESSVHQEGTLSTGSFKPVYLYSLSDPLNPVIVHQEHFLIGRGEFCHLRLQEDLVGERQSRIEFKGDGNFILRDLRSGQPTIVNQKSIQEVCLQDGDELRWGHQSFLFSVQRRAFSPPPGITSKNILWNLQLQLVGNMARTKFPVLILGPSGTGKEVLAEAIHKQSFRNQGPLIKVNCSALTETLVESELFGHVKGSFTGAVGDRKGAFEAARGGTLFLDEIGDLPYTLQAKLLRALENGEIRPVGSDRVIHTDVRIMAATQGSLFEKIRLQQFRMDLYYRLNVATIMAPPLVERMEDFETLLYTFAKEMRVRFAFGAISKLKQHSWPGNIRELKNTVARASAFFPQQTIEEEHVPRILDPLSVNLHTTMRVGDIGGLGLSRIWSIGGGGFPFSMGSSSDSISPGSSGNFGSRITGGGVFSGTSVDSSSGSPLQAKAASAPFPLERGGSSEGLEGSQKNRSLIRQIEREMILQRLMANQGNQKRTAKDLNMPKSTLHDRLRQYNIDSKTFAIK